MILFKKYKMYSIGNGAKMKYRAYYIIKIMLTTYSSRRKKLKNRENTYTPKALKKLHSTYEKTCSITRGLGAMSWRKSVRAEQLPRSLTVF